MAVSVDEEVERLFALPPEEFIAARDDAARRLREERDPDGAKRVKALRRPSVAAWAINQLPRRSSDELEQLLAVGEELRKGQRRALSGLKAGDLREVGARRRAAKNQLLAAAERILRERGEPGPHLEEVGATLDAAVVDEDAAALVRAGQLSKPLPAPATFELGGGLAVAPEAVGGTEEAAGPQPDPELDEALAEAAKARREATALDARIERAADEVQRLERTAEEARGRADAATERLDALRGEARRATREAERAEERTAHLKRKGRRGAQRRDPG